MYNADVRQYFREIKGSIPCIGKRRREILNRINEIVEGYLKENSSPSYSDLTARFGTPKQIVTSCLEEMDAEELLRRLKFGGKIVRIVAAAAVAVVVMWAVAVSIMLYRDEQYRNGYFVEQVYNVTYSEQSNGGN